MNAVRIHRFGGPETVQADLVRDPGTIRGRLATRLGARVCALPIPGSGEAAGGGFVAGVKVGQ